MGALFVAAMSLLYPVIAAPPGSPYNPGETLDPTCAPGDANCFVTPPAESGINSDITDLTALTALSVANTSATDSSAVAMSGSALTTGAVLNLTNSGSGLAFLSLIDATDSVKIFTVSTDPDGVLNAPRGSLALDYTNGVAYINTDDSNSWSQVGSGSGGNTLDQAYDQGGAGAGRAVTVDTGAIEFNGSNAGDYTLEVSTSGAGGALYINDTNGSGYALLVDNGDVRINNDLAIYDNTTIGSSSADVVVFNASVDSDFIPNGNDSYDLGSDSMRWADLYLASSSLHIGEAGDEFHITYNTASSSLRFNHGANYAEVEADGSVDVASGTYKIGNSTVLSAPVGINVFVGKESGLLNTGIANAFLGGWAGEANTTGSYNVFVGALAGQLNTGGKNNVFVGNAAGSNNIEADRNVFVGTQSGENNLDGEENVFVGQRSGRNNTSGYGNSFLGAYSGKGNSNGYNNTFIGYNSGTGNSTGYENTYLGYYSGGSNITGYGNVFIGYYAGINETGSNFFYLDNYYNDDGNTPLIYGNFASDSVAIGGTTTIDSDLTLDVNGKIGATEYCTADGANCFTYAGLQTEFGLPDGMTGGDILRWDGSDWATIGFTVNADKTLSVDLIPSGSYSLGESSNRWQDLYLASSSLHIGDSTANEYVISYDTASDSLKFGNGSTTFEIEADGSVDLDWSGEYKVSDEVVLSNKGVYNILLGVGAGENSSGGRYNTIVGKDAGKNNILEGNIFLGYEAGLNETDSYKLYIHTSNSTNAWDAPLIYGDFVSNSLAVGGLTTIDPDLTLQVNGDIGADQYCDQSGGNCFTYAGLQTEFGLPDGMTGGDILRWDGSGWATVGFTVNADATLGLNLIPSGSYSLGESSNRWQDLYLASSSLHIGEAGAEFVFNYDTASNALRLNHNGSGSAEFNVLSDGALVIGTEAKPLILGPGGGLVNNGLLTLQQTFTGDYSTPMQVLNNFYSGSDNAGVTNDGHLYVANIFEATHGTTATSSTFANVFARNFFDNNFGEVDTASIFLGIFTSYASSAGDVDLIRIFNSEFDLEDASSTYGLNIDRVIGYNNRFTLPEYVNVNEYYGLRLERGSIGSTSSVSKAYGVYVEEMPLTSNSYGIYIENDLSHFARNVDGTDSYVAKFINDNGSTDAYGLKVVAGDNTEGYYLTAFAPSGAGMGYLQYSGGTFGVSNYSDIRTKTNVASTSKGGLDIINSLRVVDFNRKNNPDASLIQGFIAQEVLDVYPEMVTNTPDGMFALMESKLVPILVKAVQEQQVLINALAGQELSVSDIYNEYWLLGEDNNEIVTNHQTKILDKLIVAGQVVFNKDTVGRATMEAGTKSVYIDFENEYDSEPIITITKVGNEKADNCYVDNVSVAGFMIKAENIVMDDVMFNWHAFAQSDESVVAEPESQNEELASGDEESEIDMDNPDTVASTEPESDEEPDSSEAESGNNTDDSVQNEEAENQEATEEANNNEEDESETEETSSEVANESNESGNETEEDSSEEGTSSEAEETASETETESMETESAEEEVSSEVETTSNDNATEQSSTGSEQGSEATSEGGDTGTSSDDDATVENE